MNRFTKFTASVIPEMHPLFPGLVWASAARSSDETRYVLNHVQIEREGLECHIVATDGRRLHVHTYDPGMFDDDIDMIEPGLYEVITKTIKLIVIAPADCTLNYPNWRAIVPDYTPKHEDVIQALTLSKMAIKSGVLLASDFASDAVGFGHGRKKDASVIVRYGSEQHGDVFSIHHDLGKAYVMPLKYEDLQHEAPLQETKSEQEATPDIPGIAPLVEAMETGDSLDVVVGGVSAIKIERTEDINVSPDFERKSREVGEASKILTGKSAKEKKHSAIDKIGLDWGLMGLRELQKLCGDRLLPVFKHHLESLIADIEMREAEEGDSKDLI